MLIFGRDLDNFFFFYFALKLSKCVIYMKLVIYNLGRRKTLRVFIDFNKTMSYPLAPENEVPTS